MTHTISIGMFIAGVVPLVWILVRWFLAGGKGKRDIKALLPLAWGILIAMSASACTGGLVGWVTYGLGWIGGQAGNATLTLGTGAQNANAETAATFGVLTQWGSAVIILLITGIAAAWKHVAPKLRKELGAGSWIGVLLGPLVGGYTLIPLINSFGLQTIGRYLFHA